MVTLFATWREGLAPPSSPSHEGHGRQKSPAALRSFEPSALLARISAPMSQEKKRFMLSQDNVCYGHWKLLFTLSVHIDGQAKPTELECAYVSFCYEIKLEPSGMQ